MRVVSFAKIPKWMYQLLYIVKLIKEIGTRKQTSNKYIFKTSIS